MQFFLPSYNFVLLKSRYFPEYPILKHLQSMSQGTYVAMYKCKTRCYECIRSRECHSSRTDTVYLCNLTGNCHLPLSPDGTGTDHVKNSSCSVKYLCCLEVTEEDVWADLLYSLIAPLHTESGRIVFSWLGYYATWRKASVRGSIRQLNSMKFT
jgi:hypothetical protein